MRILQKYVYVSTNRISGLSDCEGLSGTKPTPALGVFLKNGLTPLPKTLGCTVQSTLGLRSVSLGVESLSKAGIAAYCCETVQN